MEEYTPCPNPGSETSRLSAKSMNDRIVDQDERLKRVETKVSWLIILSVVGIILKLMTMKP